MSKKNTLYSRMGITKKDLNAMSSFLAHLFLLPISITSNIFESSNYNNKKKRKRKIKEKPQLNEKKLTIIENNEYQSFTIEHLEKNIMHSEYIDIVLLYHFNENSIVNCEISYTLKFKHGYNFFGKINDSRVEYAIQHHSNVKLLEVLKKSIFEDAKKDYKRVYYRDYDYNSPYSPAYKNKK